MLVAVPMIYACQANTVATGKNAVCGDNEAQSGEVCDGSVVKVGVADGELVVTHEDPAEEPKEVGAPV